LRADEKKANQDGRDAGYQLHWTATKVQVAQPLALDRLRLGRLGRSRWTRRQQGAELSLLGSIQCDEARPRLRREPCNASRGSRVAGFVPRAHRCRAPPKPGTTRETWPARNSANKATVVCPGAWRPSCGIEPIPTPTVGTETHDPPRRHCPFLHNARRSSLSGNRAFPATGRTTLQVARHAKERSFSACPAPLSWLSVRGARRGRTPLQAPLRSRQRTLAAAALGRRRKEVA
jgi:hypothetical protein